MQLTDAEWEFVRPYLPIGEYGPYPERLREQFAGVLWRFRTGGQWREMPAEFGAWSMVHNRFRQWRDAGVFEALLNGMLTEAARRGEVDLSLVSVDSTTVRAHHGASGVRLDPERLAAVEKAAAGHDTDLHKDRNTVERTINRMKAWRGIATRYDEIPTSYLTGFHLRASMI